MHPPTKYPGDDRHQFFMLRAIELSKKTMDENTGGPFGAVIVMNDVIIGEGWNNVTSTNNPTAHAEINAIQNACKTIASFSLRGGVIYTSCEPCPMCLAAVYWARLDKIYYANTRAQASDIDFDDSLIYDEIPKHPDRRLIPSIHTMSVKARDVFKEWEKKNDKTPY